MPRRRCRDNTDSKLKIHGDNFTYDNDDSGSSAYGDVHESIPPPSQFASTTANTSPAKMPQTPKSTETSRKKSRNQLELQRAWNDNEFLIILFFVLAGLARQILGHPA